MAERNGRYRQQEAALPAAAAIAQAGRVGLGRLLDGAAYPLAVGEVALWRLFATPEAPMPEALAACLDADEQRRAARFARGRDRRLFSLAHGLLRLVLAAHTGLAPAAVACAVSDRGKPWLPGGPEFNLSHAGDGILVAVSGTGPVGVDLEPVREIADIDDLARRCFAPDERQAWLACPGASRTGMFFAVWTRKEAYVKALGGGLSIPFDAFAVSLDRPARVVRQYPGAPHPRPELFDLPAPPGYRAALAGRADRIVCREIVL